MPVSIQASQREDRPRVGVERHRVAIASLAEVAAAVGLVAAAAAVAEDTVHCSCTGDARKLVQVEDRVMMTAMDRAAPVAVLR